MVFLVARTCTEHTWCGNSWSRCCCCTVALHNTNARLAGRAFSSAIQFYIRSARPLVRIVSPLALVSCHCNKYFVYWPFVRLVVVAGRQSHSSSTFPYFSVELFANIFFCSISVACFCVAGFKVFAMLHASICGMRHFRLFAAC